MAGAMRKMGEYLGLVEQADFDEYDEEETPAQPERRPAPQRQAAPRQTAQRSRTAVAERRPAVRPVADLDDRRAEAPARPARVRAADPVAAEPRHSSAADAGSIMNRIETVTPRTYNNARTVGEQYRSGVPVIMNLSEIADEDAKRLVDFAAGLVFGVHGSITRVTTKVFLLSPNDVQVTDEDRQRIAAGGFFDQS